MTTPLTSMPQRPSFFLPEEYKLLIIGAGPAGVSSALTAASRAAKLVLIDRFSPMERVTAFGRIANYPGLGLTTGQRVAEAFRSHLEAMKVNVQQEYITKIFPEVGYYQAYGRNKVYRASAVILSSGIVYEKKIEGEEPLVGRGVSYCLTCDGLLYAGKKVGVLAESKEGEAEAISLQQDFHCQVLFYTAYTPTPELPLTKVYPKLWPERLEKTAGGLTIISSQSRQEVEGLFIFRAAASPAELLPELAYKDGHLVVDRSMQTNKPGLFAAGDCTGRPYQMAKAVGEGQIAALSALHYLKLTRDRW